MLAKMQQANWQKQWGMIVANAWSDERLKRRLIEEPEAVLREHGIEVPYDIEFKVMVDTDQVRHLVLPLSPSGDLADEELSGSGEAYSYSYSRPCGRCGRCGCGCDRV